MLTAEVVSNDLISGHTAVEVIADYLCCGLGYEVSMLDRVSRMGLFWQRIVGTTSGIYAECRRCGRTLRDGRQHCPDCGSGDVARYEL